MDYISDFKILSRDTFDGVEKQYTFTLLNEDNIKIHDTLQMFRTQIKKAIERSTVNKTYKISLAGISFMNKPYKDVKYKIYKATDYSIVDNRTNIDEWIENNFSNLVELFDDIRNHPSWLIVKYVHKIYLRLLDIGSIAQGGYIELPLKLKIKNV